MATPRERRHMSQPLDTLRLAFQRAARAGMSLSEFLKAEWARLAAYQPLDELVGRAGQEPTLRRGEAARAVRAGRSE